MKAEIFSTVTPEQAGIGSNRVLDFLRYLNENKLTMHSVLLLRGNTLFGEYYWKPFSADFCHRMYSETKSYVSIAVGLLEEEGKIDLDAPVVGYFSDKIDGELHPYMKAQTVRQMLTMTTCAHAPNWFKTADTDRTHEYLNSSKIVRPAGSFFEYDSPGSQLLCDLVERLSGMTLFDYLNEKLFRHFGTFKSAKILKTPSGASWGDSALICTPRDMLSFARFVMNYGKWNGKRLMNEEYLKAATSRQVDNNETGHSGYDEQGYGYLIWRHDMNGFSFNGMGCQYTVCVPEKDFIFVCNGDNQGNPAASNLIFRGLKEFIVSKLGEPLEDAPTEYSKLENYAKGLKLSFLEGEKSSPMVAEIEGKTYICQPNKQGIKSFSFKFGNKKVVWSYENAQGKKSVVCGICRNEFGKFPQEGYSNEIGGQPSTDGYLYDSAASAAWAEPTKLLIKVQAIDKYFGNFIAGFKFIGNSCSVRMEKHAEAFFEEYQGEFTAGKEQE